MPFLVATELKLLLASAAIVGLVLFVAARGPNRKLRGVIACALLIVGGALFQLSQAPLPVRSIGVPKPPMAPPPPVPPAPELPAEAPAPPSDGRVTIIAGADDTSGPDQGILDAIWSRVRYEDGDLKVDSPVAACTTPDSASQPSAPEDQEAAGDSPLANARRDLAETLADYFDDLVNRPAPAVKGLRDLRATLKEISAGERRRVADEAARLRDVITRQRTIIAGDARDYALEAQISPERIIRLAQISSRRKGVGAQTTVLETALATVGVIFAAAGVLKLATRRHRGR